MVTADPRVVALHIDSDIYRILAVIDAADAAAGIVRVDTRDPAVGKLIADQLTAALRSPRTIPVDAVVRNFFAALAGEHTAPALPTTDFRKAYYTTEVDIENLVAPVLGYTHDPDYGWSTGDHVATSLVAELVDRYRNLATLVIDYERELPPSEDPQRDIEEIRAYAYGDEEDPHPRLGEAADRLERWMITKLDEISRLTPMPDPVEERVHDLLDLLFYKASSPVYQATHDFLKTEKSAADIKREYTVATESPPRLSEHIDPGDPA